MKGKGIEKIAWPRLKSLQRASIEERAHSINVDPFELFVMMLRDNPQGSSFNNFIRTITAERFEIWRQKEQQ